MNSIINFNPKKKIEGKGIKTVIKEVVPKTVDIAIFKKIYFL